MDETTSETTTKSRLDQFAQAPLQTTTELVPAATYLPLSERHGALKVEVTRNAASVRSAISEAASMLGERGFYRYPVKNRKRGTTDYVEGVSIKGAMALVKAYKNCRVSCPLIVDLGSHWRMHAVFVDFENGVEIERSFLQRKSAGKIGGDDDARREDMAYQIGQSKAERNVVLNALEIEGEMLLEECRGSIIDKVGKDADKYRRMIIQRAEERGIDLKRIEAVAGRAVRDWLATDMVRIIGMMAAIRDGMATSDETFPPLGGERHEEVAKTSERLDRFARQDTAEASLSGQAAASPPAPPSEAAAAPDTAKLQHDMIYRLLRMAQDQTITVEQRLENLEGLDIGLHDMLPGHSEFVDTCLNTAAAVAKGEMRVETAQKDLTGLVSP